MTFKLYDALELPKGCSKDEIKKAYRKLAMDHHPDKGGDAEKFKTISHAYQVLSDDEKRRIYDQVGDEGFEQGAGGPGGPFDAQSIFEQFFGRGGGFPHPFFMGDMFGGGPGGPPQRGPRKCRNIQHVIQLTNRDAFFGGQKTLKITLHKKCMKCLDTCYTCQGQGQITEMQRMGPFTTMATRPCHACNGSGCTVKAKADCAECKGRGEYTEERKIDLHIPMGVETGAIITIHGCGEQPQQPNDVAGDLLFEFLVQQDPMFERKGLDLVYKETITFVESVIGKEIEIPMYDGPIKLQINEFGIIQPNKVYQMTNKGMKTDKQRGHLQIIFKIQYPSKPLTSEAKEEILQVFKKHNV